MTYLSACHALPMEPNNLRERDGQIAIELVIGLSLCAVLLFGVILPGILATLRGPIAAKEIASYCLTGLLVLSAPWVAAGILHIIFRRKKP